MTDDAFGHVTSNERDHWALNRSPTTDSYVNNRHTGTGRSYDADGNLLQTGIPTMTYAYDAAGRMSHTNNDSIVDITQSFAGDGQILKRYEVDTIYQEGEPPYTVTSTLYQLRSTALGGKVLTEIGAQGQKLRTYVYANESLLAWQQVNYVNGVVASQVPVWEHRDASNASYRLTDTTPYVDAESSGELDPFNSNMGLENPYQFPPDPPLPHKPNIFYPGFGWGANQACIVDAVDTPCNEAMQVVNNHAGTVELARQGPDGRFPPLDLGKRVEFIGDYLIVGHSNWTQDGKDYYYQGMSFVGIVLPQNSGAITDAELNSAGNLIDKNYDPCRKLLGANDPEAPGPEGAGLALAAAQNGVDDATMIGAIWQHESGINAIDYYGDAGPAQLTISGVRNNPRLAPLVVGNAYGSWHGRLVPGKDYSFDGSVQDNVATLRNLVRFGRNEYGSNYMTAYWYGPGYTGGGTKAFKAAQAKKNRTNYANDVMRIYNKYRSFFDCLVH